MPRGALKKGREGNGEKDRRTRTRIDRKESGRKTSGVGIAARSAFGAARRGKHGAACARKNLQCVRHQKVAALHKKSYPRKVCSRLQEELIVLAPLDLVFHFALSLPLVLRDDFHVVAQNISETMSAMTLHAFCTHSLLLSRRKK